MSEIVNGYCEIADVLALLRDFDPGDAADQDVIADMITETSRDIDRETGRTFYARSETHYLDVPYGRYLWLDDDLLTLTSLTNGDGVAIPLTEILQFPANATPKYKLTLKAYSDYTWQESTSQGREQALIAVGTWGYCVDTPADIRKACKEAVVSAYKRRFGNNITEGSTITAAGSIVTPSGWPKSVWDTVRRYKRVMSTLEPQ